MKEFVDKYYAFLRPFYHVEVISETCREVNKRSQELLSVLKSLPSFAGSGGRQSTLSTTIKLDFAKYTLLSIIKLYIDASETIKGVHRKDTDEETESEAAYEEMDIVEGERKSIQRSIADLVVAYVSKMGKIEQVSRYTYEEVMQRVLRSKEREKDNITEFLKQMTDEEREVENLFKNNRLEKWSKGLQKGLTQYVKETYDEEREQMLEQALRERKLGKMGIVAEMNRDIYAMDMDEAERTADEIEREEYSMAGIPDDDDYDGYGDDAYALSYDD